MNELTKYSLSYLKADLFWSSLLISQYNNTIEDNYIHIKSLFSLGFNKAIWSFVENNPKLLEYQEVKLLYIKSGRSCNYPAKKTIKMLDCSFDLNIESLELFFIALSKKETARKKLFIESFEADRNNIEPLIYLFRESLCNYSEMKILIEKTQSELIRNVLNKLIFIDAIPLKIESPLSIYSVIYRVLNIQNHSISYTNLFDVCIKNLDLFENSEPLFLGMGIYYMKKNRLKDAQKCFYKAIEINCNSGLSYLLIGISHSMLKETEYAVKYLNGAYLIMVSSYIPSYFLAFEYQLMNNTQKARHYFKRSLSLMTDLESGVETHLIKKHKSENGFIDSRVVNSFIYCLIYSEEYDEAMSYIEMFNISNILRVFCLLFTGMIQDADNALERCKKDAAYFALKGFINHLTDNMKIAIENYEKSLESGFNTAVEKLLWMAYENNEDIKANRAFDYSNCLFESFGLNDRISI